MKLGRIVGSVVVARIAWGVIARRRAAMTRERRTRKFALLVVAAGASGAWVARRRIGTIARRLWQERQGPAPVVTREETPEPIPVAAGTQPSAKKRRKRARRTQAEQREKAARESARGGRVKVEVNATPELRAPLGESIKH